MDEYQSLIQVIALTMGAAWASGINLYATVAVLGLAANAGALFNLFVLDGCIANL